MYSTFEGGTVELRYLFMKENIRLQGVIVVVGIVLLTIKFGAYLLTESVSIFSDAMESIINVLASFVSLYSLVVAARPRDEDHPYGHGKVELIAALFEGSLILVAGLLIVIKGLYSFYEPPTLMRMDVGVAVVAFTGCVNFGFGWLARRRGQDSKSSALIAGGEHLLSDAYSTLALVLGMLLIPLTGLDLIDSFVAIGFSFFIIYTGWQILRRTFAGIMDEADTDLLEQVVSIFQQHRVENWIDMHNLRIIKYGHSIHIDCHVTLPYFLSMREAHAEAKNIEHLVNAELNAPVEIFIHLDDCLPQCCAVCSKKNCPARTAVQQRMVFWQTSNVLPNQKHTIHTV
jgi:cation diffusion facilitator family transporter